MDLSLIFPVFDSASFIETNIQEVLVFLRPLDFRFEVIIVNDGSTDETRQVLAKISSPELKVIHLPSNQGKYAALKAGVEAASGSCIILCDADLPYSLEALPYIVELINNRKFHVVIGDRTLPESERIAELSWVRRMCSSVFGNIVRLLFTGQVFDSQCGLKGLRSDVAKAIFALIRDRQFAGDVELVYIALKYNLELKRIPVCYVRSSPSTVSLLKHSPKLLFRLLSLPIAWRLGWYKSETLRRIASQKYWS